MRGAIDVYREGLFLPRELSIAAAYKIQDNSRTNDEEILRRYGADRLVCPDVNVRDIGVLTGLEARYALNIVGCIG